MRKTESSRTYNEKQFLYFADWFEPGYKAGGPIRSCVHFVNQMKDEYKIYVFTTDRDLNDTTPYPTIEADKWIEYDKGVNVFYCSPQLLSWSHIRTQVKKDRSRFYLPEQYVFWYFTIYPLLMQRLGSIKSKIVLAPRGMLKESAVQFKSSKKKLFHTAIRQIGLHRLSIFMLPIKRK